MSLTMTFEGKEIFWNVYPATYLQKYPLMIS